MSEQDAALVDALSDYYGIPTEELQTAARILGLPDSEFVVRFTEFVSFSRAFGVEAAALARFIADRSTGIQSWRTSPLEKR